MFRRDVLMDIHILNVATCIVYLLIYFFSSVMGTSELGRMVDNEPFVIGNVFVPWVTTSVILLTTLWFLDGMSLVPVWIMRCLRLFVLIFWKCSKADVMFGLLIFTALDDGKSRFIFIYIFPIRITQEHYIWTRFLIFMGWVIIFLWSFWGGC